MVAIVLMLQARGQLTVPVIAEELEVSERTARRDLDALLCAGVPLYSQRGRGGGWALLDGHKLDLSGLTAPEAQALFLVAGPQALSGLGVEEGVRSALRKLLVALPQPVRDEAARATERVHVDPARWSGTQDAAPPAVLATLREAVLAGRQVDIDYQKAGTEQAATRRVHPYGLVSKAGVWYLMAGTEAGMRTFRLSRVRSAEMREEQVERPEGFDLEAAWGEVRARFAGLREVVSVEFEVAPEIERYVVARLESWIAIRSSGNGPGTFTAGFPHEAVAVAELARFGGRVRVLSPETVRARLAALGRELVDAYERGG